MLESKIVNGHPWSIGCGDIIQHPRTTKDQNAEFLTQRKLRVKLLSEL